MTQSLPISFASRSEQFAATPAKGIVIRFTVPSGEVNRNAASRGVAERRCLKPPGINNGNVANPTGFAKKVE